MALREPKNNTQRECVSVSHSQITRCSWSGRTTYLGPMACFINMVMTHIHQKCNVTCTHHWLWLIVIAWTKVPALLLSHPYTFQPLCVLESTTLLSLWGTTLTVVRITAAFLVLHLLSFTFIYFEVDLFYKTWRAASLWSDWRNDTLRSEHT